MQAIPMFPSSDTGRTKAFYEALGFECDLHMEGDNPYLIMVREELELHFWSYPELEPAQSIISCYVRFDLETEFNETFELFSKASLPATGIPRLSAPEVQPWGMKEFYLVDLDGNLVKCGILHLDG